MVFANQMNAMIQSWMPVGLGMCHLFNSTTTSTDLAWGIEYRYSTFFFFSDHTHIDAQVQTYSMRPQKYMIKIHFHFMQKSVRFEFYNIGSSPLSWLWDAWLTFSTLTWQHTQAWTILMVLMVSGLICVRSGAHPQGTFCPPHLKLISVEKVKQT